MTLLALLLTRRGGLPRAVLVAASTALVTSLLLVVVALSRLPARPQEVLFQVVADPGTRPGVAAAVALLTIPPVLLLLQAVRLGSAARDRRLAGLRVAGATAVDVRRIGAVEVGAPALVGALLGVLLYGALRVVLGGVDLRTDPAARVGTGGQLVPTTVGPTVWQLTGVVAAVTLLGVVVGWRGASGVAISPLGVTRRQPAGPPRPWLALLLLGAAVAVAACVLGLPGVDGTGATALSIVAVGAAVLGVTGLASWSAYRAGLAAERRVTSAAGLLGARRLVVDPRPAGRAAAAVGGIALVSGGAAAVLADVTASRAGSFYLVSLGLVALALLLALLVVEVSLAVHSAETLLQDKRSVAALVAQGVSRADLARSQRWELLLAALPVAVVGVLLGTAVVGALSMQGGPSALLVVLNLVLTPGLVIAAALLATTLTRPLLHAAASPEHLRTE